MQIEYMSEEGRGGGEKRETRSIINIYDELTIQVSVCVCVREMESKRKMKIKNSL
jgi:hypothetical protein